MFLLILDFANPELYPNSGLDIFELLLRESQILIVPTDYPRESLLRYTKKNFDNTVYANTYRWIASMDPQRVKIIGPIYYYDSDSKVIGALL